MNTDSGNYYRDRSAETARAEETALIVENTMRDRKKETSTRQWLFALLANVPVLSYGLEAGWMSSAGRMLQSPESPAGTPLTADQIGWLASILCLTAAFGSVLGAVLADKIGRKYGLLVTSVPQAISWSMRLVWTSYTGIFVARALTGLSAGACFVIPPMYVREISTSSNRGSLGAILMVANNTGLVLMYILGAAFDYYTLLWISLPLPLLHVVFTIFAPETPAYLVKLEKTHEAALSLAKLRGLDSDDKSVQCELYELREDNERSKATPSTSLISMVGSKPTRRALILCMVLIGTQAIAGHLGVLMNAASLLQDSGIDLRPEIQAVAVGALFFLGSLFSLTLVERLGRKPLQLGSNILQSLWLGILGLTPLLAPLGWVPEPPAWMPAFLLGAVVFSYALGLAPVPYIVMSEVFSFQTRATANGFLVTFAWLLSFTQLLIFSPLYAAFGNAAFVVFCAITVAGAIATAILMPETKGRTLAEIQAKLCSM